MRIQRNFPYKRADRISGEIQKDISDMIMRGILKDPSLEGINISQVWVADDLKTVKVYFTKLGSSIRTEDVLDGFYRANNFLRRIIARNLRLKALPEFYYYYDSAFDHSEKISKLLYEIQDRHV